MQDVILRLVPETSEVSRDGAYLFVLTELTSNLKGSAIVRVEAKGATLSAVPGQGLCATGTGQEISSTTGEPGDAKTFDSGTLVIADTELSKDSVRDNVKSTGIIVSIPPGEEDVLLVASAYGHTASADSCTARDQGLIAIGSVRIVRETGGDGSRGQGGAGGDVAGSAAGASGAGGGPGPGGGGGEGAVGGAAGSGGAEAGGGQGGEPGAGGFGGDNNSGASGSGEGGT